ncbi:DNA-binding MarR family transcriptional regulator [Pseudosporangium ferrugineum]|uniref:DNA-binding MarR family transcriptional regulator n=2 Tax=Pseudosporangium ferrugineum TaxID=439699 RepID=A0A2T0S4D0_9ACTN|nr:DNA-binding MarR family transcriptional regulator [Pseudosporangium ferrugineum]
MRAIARLMLVLPRMLDADLVHDQRMPMSEYATLRTLSEAPGRIMRMSELATACFMSLSGMTRLAAKLESVGYLARLPCESDGRGFNAVLTDAGLARLQEAWPSHLASVRRRIFDHLGDVDLPQFAAVLTAMTAPVGPACDSAGCDA